MIVNRRTLTASGTPETSGHGFVPRLLFLVLFACFVLPESPAWADPDPSPSESLVVHRHRHVVSVESDAGSTEPATDAGGPVEVADAGEAPPPEVVADAGDDSGLQDAGAPSESETAADAGGAVEASDAGDSAEAPIDAGNSSETTVDAGEDSTPPDAGEPLDAGLEQTQPEDAGSADTEDAGTPAPEADAGTTSEPDAGSSVDDAGTESPDAGEPGSPATEGTTTPDQPADAGTGDAPVVTGEPAPVDDSQQQAILRVVFYGVYDSVTDSMDSDRARDAERAIRKSMEGWWGFEAVSQGDLDKRVDKVSRGFIAQSARPALRLATVPGDFGLTAKLRLHEGQPMIRLRVISQPDRDPGREPVFDDVWTEELPADQLPRLIEMARDEVYRLANERVQLKSWPNAAIMHVPPPVAIAGKKVALSANLLCRGECGLVLHFFFVDPEGKADAVQKTPMSRDEKTGVFRAEIKNGATGKLRYYFTVEARDGRVLRADISTGTRDEPFEFRILAPLLGEEARPASPAGVPDAALQPQATKPSPVGGAVTLGMAGVVGVGAVIMGVLTHVWYTQPITEVQAAQAKTFVAPVYSTVGVAGALAIVGSILLSTELRPHSAEPAPETSLDSP